MSNHLRSSAAPPCALAVAAALAASAPASAASVIPHVFEGGITLVDLANENLDPWGFYDGTKGMPVPSIASGREIARPGMPAGPVPGGWIAASGGGVPEGDGESPAGAPLFAPMPVRAGLPGASSPCFWGDDRFGRSPSRDRCGHPVPAPAFASPQPSFVAMPRPMILVPSGPGADPTAPAGPVTPVPVPVPLPATAWLLGAAVIASVLRKRCR